MSPSRQRLPCPPSRSRAASARRATPGTRHPACGTRHAGYAPRPPGTPTAAAGSLALPAPPHPRPRARNPHPISPLARDHWARAPPRTRDQRTGHQPPEPPLPSCHPTSRARSRHSRHELALRGSRATFGHVVPAPRTSWAVSRGWHGLIALGVTASLAVPLTLIFTGRADANSGQTGEASALASACGGSSATAPSRATWSCSPLLRCRCGAPLWTARSGAWCGWTRSWGSSLVFAIVLAPQVHLTRSRPVRDHRLPLHLPAGDDRGVAAVRAARGSRGRRSRAPSPTGTRTRSWT